jgi:hypothetical protein
MYFFIVSRAIKESNMNNKDKSRTPKFAYAKVGVLFLILVVFPFGAWFYLKQGINFRKEALAELKAKSDPLAINLLVDGKSVGLADLGKRVTTVFRMDNISPLQMDLIRKYVEQFRATNDINFVGLHVGVTSQLVVENLSDLIWINTESPEGSIIDSLLSKVDSQAQIFVLDRESIVRNHFSEIQEQNIKELVIQTAVLMPPSNSRSLRTNKKAEL